LLQVVKTRLSLLERIVYVKVAEDLAGPGVGPVENFRTAAAQGFPAQYARTMHG